MTIQNKIKFITNVKTVNVKVYHQKVFVHLFFRNLKITISWELLSDKYLAIDFYANLLKELFKDIAKAQR